MKNKSFVLGMILAATLVVSQQVVVAQQGQGRGQGRAMMSPEDRVKQLKEQLTLTDDQTTKVQKIFEENQKKMTDMRASYQGDFDGMRAAMQLMQAKQDSTIEKLLTADQLKKYEGVKKERQQRMQNMQRRQGN
ncbi:MAG TPA: hypothetical protein VI704_03955 [Bacteroidota bacterium]|nr:hypothetical protein [Bacteroidota bacterium]